MAETSDFGDVEFLNRVTALVDTLTSLGTEYQMYFESPDMPLEGENEEGIQHPDGTFEIVGEETNAEALQRVRSAVDGLDPDPIVRTLEEMGLRDAAGAFDDLRSTVLRIAHTDVSESASPEDDPFADREHEILKIDVYAKQAKAIDALVAAARKPGRAQPTPQATAALLDEVEGFIETIATLGIEYQTIVAGYPELDDAHKGSGAAMDRISKAQDTLEPRGLIRKLQLSGFEDAADALDKLWGQVSHVIILEAVGIGIEPKDIVAIDVKEHRQRAVESVNRARASLG